MKLKSIPVTALLLGCALAIPGPLGSASAEPHRNIPQSEALEHESDLASLRQIAERTTQTGLAAQHLMAVLSAHQALEEAFILPPLTLLSALTDGTVTPDMLWAVEMSDHVRAERETLRRMHGTITEAVVNLRTAADAENDKATVALAENFAAADLADMEVIEPMVLAIGIMLRSKLPPQ